MGHSTPVTRLLYLFNRFTKHILFCRNLMTVKLIKFSKSLFGPSFNVLLLSYSHIKEFRFKKFSFANKIIDKLFSKFVLIWKKSKAHH